MGNDVDRKKIKVGDVFETQELGLVRYVRPDEYFGEITCLLHLMPENDGMNRFPSWKSLWDKGFDMDLSH